MKRTHAMVLTAMLAVALLSIPSVAFADQVQVVQASDPGSVLSSSSAVSTSTTSPSSVSSENSASASSQATSSSNSASSNASASSTVGTGGVESSASVAASTSSSSATMSSEATTAVAPAAASTWLTSNGSYTYTGAETGWVVTANSPDGVDYGLQRYWVDVNRKLAVDRLITASEAGYYAYATAQGFVVRGKYVASDGSVYLADNDGKLEDAGWLVSGSYTNGDLQRYYIDSNSHAAKTGLFDVDGSSYYGIANEGYELRGAAVVNGTMMIANNDGVLAKSTWVVTDGFGQGLQRYWFGADAAPAQGLINAGNGWYAYGTPAGYVVRGKYIASDGNIYLANNDGVLENAGWVVSDAYGDGLQRYFIDATSHACMPGKSDDGYPHYTLASGYVLRGPLTTSGGIYIADNDGKLANTSWVVTDVFGQGLQRYWFGPDATMAVNEIVDGRVAGWWAYATSSGYVLRGTYAFTDSDGFSNIYIADNDGKLISSSASDGAGWLVTGDYADGALQRYYVNPKTHALLFGFFTVDGSSYYAYPNSRYVVRGKYSYDSIHMLLADNDGKMADAAGWLVSDAYDGGLQRYYLELVYSGSAGSYYGAKLGLFTADGNSYFGRYDQGYVVRGDYYYNGTWYEGDNDGVLQTVKPLLNGFDISSAQGGMDLGSVAYDFAIVKSTQGTDYTNPYFSTWADAVLNAGKMLGIYHYADGAGAVAEAQYFVQTISGYIGRAVLFLDWETTTPKDDPLRLGENTAFYDTGYAKTFLDTVYGLTGVKPLIYMSKSFTRQFDWSSIAGIYPLWVAQYPNYDAVYGYQSDPWTDDYSTGAWTSPTVFQYTSQGHISGYDGRLDLDLFYGGRPLWNQLSSKS